MGAASGRAITSNMVRADYVGSAVCEGCHAEIYAAWQHSPMREMTRLPEGARIRAPFDGREFRFKDDSARFEQRGDARFVRIASRQFGDHLYRVTRVIGGRYREDYAGVEVAAMDGPAALPDQRLGDRRAELILPVSFIFETASFRLKGYSVMVGERPGLRAGGVWNQTCVFCHNTNPAFDSTWGELFGADAPGYQGQMVDRLLPPERRFSFEVTDEDALAGALADEVRFVGGTLDQTEGPDRRRRILGSAIKELRGRLTADHFVEVGIGCESCHGGSREHVKNDRVLPDFQPRSRFMRARPPAGSGEVGRAEWINRACARCHQVLFSRYPFTWEGGLRRSKGKGAGAAPPGGSNINSGEARDFLLGGCARQMSCVTCHDPHAEDKPEALARLQRPEGNRVCTACHPKLADATALRTHAHHDPAGAGGVCINCHMPRKNMGLGYGLTRYHRIGSPTERVRVEEDRPLECALCHPRKTVEELVSAMERFWGKRYDRGALALLYGELGGNGLVATAQRGKAHEQAVAISVLREHGVSEALPAVARQLINPFPLVRYYARKAVQSLSPKPCAAVDLDRPLPEIEEAVRRCLPEARLPALPRLPVPSGTEAPSDD
jgi:predicted CXXCH cytochrome family protein